jgi:hypothetical protein
MKRYIIKKARSTKVTTLTQLDKDDWFYSLVTTVKGELYEKGMVVKKDLPLWLEKADTESYKIVEESL